MKPKILKDDYATQSQPDIEGPKLIEMTAVEQTPSFSDAENARSASRQNSVISAELSASGMRIRVLTSEQEIDSIRDVWKSLCTSPNSDPDYFLTVVRSSPEVRSAYVLIVERDGEIKALLVGRVEDRAFDVHLGYARLPQPKVKTLVFIYGGFLGTPSQEECAALADSISQALKSGVADVAFFNHLLTDSPLYPMLLRHVGILARDRFPNTAVHRRITIPAGTDALWKQFPYKARGNFRWNVKTFLKSHADSYSIEFLSKPSELDDMVRKVEAVATKTYQRGLGVGFGANPTELDRLRFKAEQGWLQVYVLSINGVPAAFLCGTLYQSVFHADHMGFDPEYRRSSPGIFLTLNVVEKFCELKGDKRVTAIDFGLGDARYKADLCNISWEDGSLYLFAPRLRGMVLSAYRIPVLLADRLARRIFNASVQEKIKSKWRALSRSKTKPAPAQQG